MAIIPSFIKSNRLQLEWLIFCCKSLQSVRLAVCADDSQEVSHSECFYLLDIAFSELQHVVPCLSIRFFEREL